jgi:putative sterol carrier protein
VVAVIAEAPAVPVRLAGGAESGFARIVCQYLEQNLEESDARRRRAARLRGRVAMTASDHEQTVTLVFAGDEVEVLDGAQEPLDAAIAGPYDTLVRLIQGEASPLLEHLRRRIRVRSRLKSPFLPLHVHNLMKLAPPGETATGVRRIPGLAWMTGLALGVGLGVLISLVY